LSAAPALCPFADAETAADDVAGADADVPLPSNPHDMTVMAAVRITAT
jgi:hypothetical protein